ncbi:acyl carrier protein [Olsenella urininfantis]|uniref:acyl carrier protein n=1 Tax=Olsenella urininfantis TaxID=1871033 RepID=UPI0009872DD5|nr:acyl carrier protein [Olsenella urininfantis]
MDHDGILEKVILLTSEELEVDAAGLGEDTAFKDLGADSFDLLELVTSFEDEFAATLEDEELNSIATIGDAVRAIECCRG